MFTLRSPDRTPLHFGSREDLNAWTKEESDFWRALACVDQRATAKQRDLSERHLSRIATAIAQEAPDEDIQAHLDAAAATIPFLRNTTNGAALQAIRTACGDAAAGMAFVALVDRESLRTALERTHTNVDAVTGLAGLTAFTLGGDPDRLQRYLATVAETQTKLDEVLRQESERARRNDEAHAASTDAMRTALARAETALRERAIGKNVPLVVRGIACCGTVGAPDPRRTRAVPVAEGRG
jgi:malonyl CoA-acyl carrier protein transacylase